MKGLYAIVDTTLLARRGTDPVAYARAVLAARPAAVLLRAKDVPSREFLCLLRAIGPLCRQIGVPFVANDRADLAALGGCDLVHIGPGDLPYDLVHRIAPHLGVGISAHDLAQVDRALSLRPRYVAFGPVFDTDAAPSVGLDALRTASAAARAAQIPFVASGGITLEHAQAIAPHADACAVIADLYPEGATLDDVRLRASAFQAALCPVSTRGAA